MKYFRIPSRRLVKTVAVLVLAGTLCACSTSFERADGPPSRSVDVSAIPDAVPRAEPRSRYGNPDSYVVNGKRYHVRSGSDGFVQRGIASWYGEKFHGRRTSSGDTYDMYAMTAAHKSLPLPTYVEVVNLDNGARVVVRVNDRGPFHDNRIIDLSYVAAKKLDIVSAGTGLVEVRAIDAGSPGRERRSGDGILARAGSAGFYIQVGAFSNYTNARNLQIRLNSAGGITAHISEVSISGRPTYRVRIGPIRDVDVADRIVGDLGRYGITEHHIVLN